MLLLIESIVICFVLLIVCVIGIANEPVGLVALGWENKSMVYSRNRRFAVLYSEKSSDKKMVWNNYRLSFDCWYYDVDLAKFWFLESLVNWNLLFHFSWNLLLHFS